MQTLVIRLGGQSLLHGNRTFDCVDDAVERHQRTIAGQLDDLAAVGGHFAPKDSFDHRHNAGMGASFVALHQPAVSDDIDRHDRCQFAVHRTLQADISASFYSAILMNPAQESISTKIGHCDGPEPLNRDRPQR
nr:hypothetical protein [Mesorhizobium sp.]